MNDRTSDPAGQASPSHLFHARIWEEPDGCRTFELHHISADDLDAVQRVLERNTDALPPALVAKMIDLKITGGRGRRTAITKETAQIWVASIRKAVAKCRADGVRPTYATVSERMRPYAYSAYQFGVHVRDLAALGYGPWPAFFEREE
jgi:hypothetical protein